MGRKRNQGKARKAAKAKAREEAEEERGNDNNNQRRNERQQLLAAQMQQLQLGNSNLLPTSGSDATKCRHGFEKMDNMCIDFVIEFRDAFHEAGNRGKSTFQSLVYAEDTTMEKFAVVWKDFAKMEITMSYYLFHGTKSILEGTRAKLPNLRSPFFFLSCLVQTLTIASVQRQTKVASVQTSNKSPQCNVQQNLP